MNRLFIPIVEIKIANIKTSTNSMKTDKPKTKWIKGSTVNSLSEALGLALDFRHAHYKQTKELLNLSVYGHNIFLFLTKDQPIYNNAQWACKQENDCRWTEELLVEDINEDSELYVGDFVKSVETVEFADGTCDMVGSVFRVTGKTLSYYNNPNNRKNYKKIYYQNGKWVDSIDYSFPIK